MSLINGKTTIENQTEFKSKLSSSDNTGDFLGVKLTSDNTIDITEVTQNSIEKLEIAVNTNNLGLTTDDLSDFDLSGKTENDILTIDAAGDITNQDWDAVVTFPTTGKTSKLVSADGIETKIDSSIVSQTAYVTGSVTTTSTSTFTLFTSDALTQGAVAYIECHIIYGPDSSTGTALGYHRFKAMYARSTTGDAALQGSANEVLVNDGGLTITFTKSGGSILVQVSGINNVQVSLFGTLREVNVGWAGLPS